MLLNDIVLYAVNRLNMRRPASSQGDAASKVRFTGRKPDFNKEFGSGFGDYVECGMGKLLSILNPGRVRC